MLRSMMAVVLMLSVAGCLLAGPSVGPGTKAPAFSLKDVEGKDHALSGFLASKYVVIMFIATQCPVSNAYNERMAKLHADYTSRGVTFVGINSNKQEGVEEIREHSAKNGFKFTVLKDPGNAVADAYGAEVTPEVFVVDAQGIVRYHGRIDDNRDASEVSSQDLRSALDAMIDGKEPPRAETKAFGCTIKRVKK